MSFKAVAAGIAKKQGISMDRASAELAVGTRRNMAKRGISSAHGIPKNVFGKNMPPKGIVSAKGNPMGDACLKKHGIM